MFCERQFFFLSSNSTQDIYSTRNATTLLEKVAFMTGKEKKFVKRGKHKRGDRGSSEEGNSAPKKQNMAACEASPDDNETEDVFEPSEEEETSLNELKALLEGVQETLLEIRTENQRMVAEITELKSSFKNHSMEISDLKTALKKEQNENEVLKKSLKSLKAKADIQEREINELYGQQDDLEQYTRKHSLEIHGIPENLYTSTDDVVIKLGERLNVPIAKEEIDISHKLYNGKNHPKSIIVKFINYKKKAQLYRKRTELKNVKISELFSACSVADATQSTRIFINENLTQYRRKIMNKANQMKREGTILSAWSLDGKLYVKTSPNGTPTRIYCEEDLNNL